MKNTVNIGIIGLGFGKNYLLTFNMLENANVKWICARRMSTISKALADAKNKSNINTTTNYKDILEDNNVDAVAIVTPGSTHYMLAREALLAGKHVIVEKPVAFKSKEVMDLISISKKRKKILMAGHVHLFNPGIKKIKEDTEKGLFGNLKSINSIHLSKGIIRNDMGALWDFFPHPVSIALYLAGKMPVKAKAYGKSYLQKGIGDIAIMELIFPNGMALTAFCSWLSSERRMELSVTGEKICATFDDYAKEKLKYYSLTDNKTRKIHIKPDKPLTEELKHFLYCIENSKIPITDGYEALQVTKVLEAADKSLKSGKTEKI
mgnify:CR=1 FL=1